MAFSKATVLCLLLAVSSGLARPIAEEQTGRQLLQTVTDPTAIFQNLVASGADQASLTKALTNVFQSGGQQAGTDALALGVQTAKAAGSTSQLNGAVNSVATGGTVPATSIGSAISTVTGSPPINPNTLTSGNANVNVFAGSDGGLSVVSGTATSQAQSIATNAIAVAVAKAITDVNTPGANPTAVATACAQAIGTASATAISSVTIKGSVGGSGVVTGTGSANAAAFAQAFSQAIAAAFAKAKSGGNTASAAVLSQAATSSYALALSNAQASLVQNGPGTASTSITSISQSIVKAISTSIAQAVAAVGPSSTTGR